MKYRADIDGLRAVAVLAVVLFHAHVPGFGGGYVGVDVFFVISGFLITTLLQREIEQRRLSILGFYERRVRRIFPALALVLAVTVPVAWFTLLAPDLERYGRSLTFTALFSSNFSFWTESGYFQTGAELKPLLHTWSLAVEEQFYLTLPLFLVLMNRVRVRARWGVAALAVLSFAIAAWSVSRSPSAAFYLPFSRAWELLLGSWLAVGGLPPLRARWQREVAGVAGLVGIGWAVVAWSEATGVPGLAALPPCLGTAAILHAGRSGTSLVGRGLSVRPMVVVGLLSYALYLWHWPVLAFVRYRSILQPEPVVVAVALAASLGLAALSYRFVEVPLRYAGRPRRQVFAVAAGMLVAASAVGSGLWASDGAPWRQPSEVATLLEAYDSSPANGPCFPRMSRHVQRDRLCVAGAEVPPAVVLWGDSHGHTMAPGLVEAASGAGRSVVLATTLGCPPLLGVDVRTNDCAAFNDAVLAYLDRHHIRDVVLVARWALYVEGTPYGPFDGGPPPTEVRARAGGARIARDVLVAAGLRGALEALRGRRVWLVRDVPEVGYDVPSALAREALYGVDVAIEPSTTAYRERQARSNALLDEAATTWGATVLDPGVLLCDERSCRVVVDGHPLYVDDDHLSLYGARSLAPLFAPLFAGSDPGGR